MRSKTVDRLLKSTPRDVEIFVDWYADIVVRVNQLLRENEIVETVKLETKSAVNEALKSREAEIAETGLLEGISIEVVSKLTGLSTIEVQNIANRLGLDK